MSGSLADTILKRSLGLPLVLLGFMLVYFKGAFRTSEEAGIADYVVYGFSAVVTLAGILFMAVEVRRVGAATSDLETAVSSSDLEVTIKELAKNLDIHRAQATQGFVTALIMMVLGICVILAGAVGEMFGFAVATNNLTTVAGIVVEVVSGLGLVLFKSTFARLNRTSDTLLDIWKILAALKRAEALPDAERTQLQVSLINRLAGETDFRARGSDTVGKAGSPSPGRAI